MAVLVLEGETLAGVPEAVPEDLTEVDELTEGDTGPPDARVAAEDGDVIVFLAPGTVPLAKPCGETAVVGFEVPVAGFGAPAIGKAFEVFGGKAPVPGTTPATAVSGFDGTPGRRSASISTARAAPV